MSWDDIVSRTLDQDPKTTDEHIYKVIHVVRDQAASDKNAAMDGIYKRAALMALKYPLHF